MSERFTLRSKRPEAQHITTNMSLKDAAVHSGLNAAGFLTQIKRSKDEFPQTHRFHNEEYVAKVFWTNVRNTMEYWREAKKYGFDTTIGEANELRQQGIHKRG